MHGVALDGMYSELTNLFRADADMMANFQWLVLGELILAVFFCAIFTYGYKNTGIGEGLRFGVMVGIGFGVSTALISYAVMPLT